MGVPARGGREGKGQLIIGRISRPYGVKGWLRLSSYCRPEENIFAYKRWLIGRDTGWQSRQVLAHKQQGRQLLARLEGIAERELAHSLVGLAIAIETAALPEPAPGEYYWAELLGMEVFDRDGKRFGRVADIQETGANDVLFVGGEKPCLIPFVQEEIVQDVDLENRRIVVDWNPEYI